LADNSRYERREERLKTHGPQEFWKKGREKRAWQNVDYSAKLWVFCLYVSDA